MSTIWKEIRNIKLRLDDLEFQDVVILHEAVYLLNSETLERDLISLMHRIKVLTKKFGKIQIVITSGD